MSEIIPSIIAHNFEEVKAVIARLDGLVGWAQLDIMDGLFVTPVTWSVAEDLKTLDGNIRLEAHLMVEQPEEVLKYWAEVSDRILIHYEATNDLQEIINTFDNSWTRLGVVLNMKTEVEVLKDLTGKIDVVQLMSIDKTGYSGEKLDAKVYDKINALRNLWPDVRISIDGGITLDNAPKLITAGVDQLVVGSAIWQSDNIEETIKKFQNLVP